LVFARTLHRFQGALDKTFGFSRSFAGTHFMTQSANTFCKNQGPWQKLTGTTIDSPSFYVSGGYMWIVVKGADNGIHWRYVNTETFAQGSWHKLTGSTERSPAISYGDSGGLLYRS